jgi:Tetratricopeptide repeat
MPTWSDQSADWPKWSVEAAPGDLARYVVPDVVRRHVDIPGPSSALVLDRLRAVWDRLRQVGIGYAHERWGSGRDGQWIRPPGEMLVAPRNGTCLDLAVLVAGALGHAGLRTAIVVLDAVDPGRPGHAVVAVLLRGTWPGTAPDGGLWTAPPPGFLTAVQTGLDGPPREVLVLDPNGMAHGLGATVSGMDVDLESAAVAGHAHLTSGSYRWRVGVICDRNADPYTPSPVPRVLPLRAAYREPTTAESALRLLRAEYQVTPFQSRDELTVLSGLCEDSVDGQSTALVVVTGRGGAGKTRLALELVDRMGRDGWYAGALRERARAGQALDWLAEVTAPLLVLVDYADARAASTIEVLRVLARRRRPAVVVLTAREREGEWLNQITDALVSDSHPYRLMTLELPDAHPRPKDVFLRTCTALDRRPDRTPSQLPSADRGTRWTTLDLVLLGWLAARTSGPLPVTPAALYDEVLRHERRYWNSAFESHTGVPLRYSDLLAEAAACLTLLTPAPKRAAQALTAVERLVDAKDLREQVAATLVTCLDPGPGEYVAIRPDPIGDHHLLTTLARRPDLLERCLEVGSGLREGDVGEGTLTALSVLTRAGRTDRPAAAAHVEALLRTEPGRWPLAATVASALGGVARTVLEDLAAAPETPLPLDDMSAGLPFGAAGLWRLGLVVDERRLERARAQAPDDEDLGELLFQVSRRRRDAGDRAGALAASQEAVNLYRTLATADPDYIPGLAGLLSDLSVHRGDAGDVQAATEPAEEAVRLRRQLAADDPQEAVPDLAASLNNLSTCRSAAGDRNGALDAITEAVALYRELADADPDFYSDDLAMSLNNLSNCRAELDDRTGALEAIEEAVRLRRGLHPTTTDGPSPNLAHVLNNLSERRSDTGDYDAALAAAEEATGLYRELVTINVAAFTPDLAMSLNTLSVCRSRTGNKQGALAAAEEATALYRGLVAIDQAAHLPDLAMSLNTLSNRRAETGDRAGALAAATEAVALYHSLPGDDASAVTANRAAALNNLSECRSATGDKRGALEAAEESTRLHRALAETNTGAFGADLARSLNTLAIRRSEIGDRAGALRATEEAVAVRRELAAREPAAFERELAASLSTLSNRLWEVGERAQSSRAGGEAVAIYRELAEANRAAVASDLAAAVSNLSVQVADVGDRDRALALGQEAIDLYRELVESNHDAWAHGLAAALNNQSVQLADAGDHARALAAAEEAVAHYRDLAAVHRTTFLADLAMAVNNLARCRYDSDDRLGALEAAEEAVGLYRETLADETAGVGGDDLARSLNNLSIMRAEQADYRGALAAALEAVDLYQEQMTLHPAALALDLSRALNNVGSARSALDDRRGALDAAQAATRLLRDLVHEEPAFAPDLAGTLMNLSSALLATGDSNAALEAGKEAADLYRRIAATDFASFTPYLGGATGALADLLTVRSPSEAPEAWAASAEVLPSTACRAEIWAYAADWYVRHGDTPQATECLRRAAALAGPTDELCPTYVMSRARQEIRTIAMSIDPVPPELPPWAVHHLSEPDLELARAWSAAHSWPEAEAVLQARTTVVTGATLADSLDIQIVLNPGDSALQQLRHLVARIQNDGLKPVLAQRRWQDAAENLVRQWISQPTWTESFAYLRAHRDELGTEQATAFMADLDNPAARRHAAILTLLRTLPVETVEDVVTNTATAVDHALEAVDHGKLNHVADIIEANPDVADEPGAGFVLRAVLLLADGQTEQAVNVIRAGAGHTTAVQRQARIVNLRRLAATQDPRRPPAVDSLVQALTTDTSSS